MNPGYSAVREGKYSPAELSRCACVDDGRYHRILECGYSEDDMGTASSKDMDLFGRRAAELWGSWKKSEKRSIVTVIKEKHLDRREWYADSERDFVCMYHRDDFFHGGIGLITFTGLSKPEVVSTPEGPLCIADNGYQWLEIVPEEGHFAVTAMFHDGILFQQYIDITLRNEVDEDGNAVFYDLLLDVVILGDGTPQIVDTEELETALSDETIKRDEYELARQTADQIVETWNLHKTQIGKKLYEYRDLFHRFVHF